MRQVDLRSTFLERQVGKNLNMGPCNSMKIETKTAKNMTIIGRAQSKSSDLNKLDRRGFFEGQGVRDGLQPVARRSSNAFQNLFTNAYFIHYWQNINTNRT